MTAIRILVGSVYGGALMTAREIRKELEADGHQVTVLENPTLPDITSNDEPLLVCTSTTGQGEIPENLLHFYVELREQWNRKARRCPGSGTGSKSSERLQQTNGRSIRRLSHR